MHLPPPPSLLFLKFITPLQSESIRRARACLRAKSITNKTKIARAGGRIPFLLMHAYPIGISPGITRLPLSLSVGSRPLKIRMHNRARDSSWYSLSAAYRKGGEMHFASRDARAMEIWKMQGLRVIAESSSTRPFGASSHTSDKV